MTRSRTIIPLAGVIAAMAIAATPAAAQEHHIVVKPDQVQWGPAPPVLPAGAQIAVLEGDPSASGPAVLRLKFPANYAIPPHWHSMAERVTVISGMLNVAAGDVLDRTAGTALGPGGYVSLPAKMHHYAWAKVPTVVQINLDGPFDIFYINPSEDPTKTPSTR